eukprot:31478-Pelagococcus_subviridis.AAC.6
MTETTRAPTRRRAHRALCGDAGRTTEDAASRPTRTTKPRRRREDDDGTGRLARWLGPILATTVFLATAGSANAQAPPFALSFPPPNPAPPPTPSIGVHHANAVVWGPVYRTHHAPGALSTYNIARVAIKNPTTESANATR